MTAEKRVLLTGATGFIGSRCLPRLLARGYEVHAVSSRHPPAIAAPGLTWHQCDLLDAQVAVRLAEALRATHLMHLAWIAVPGKFWNSPDNLRWLSAGVSLIDAFFRYGGKRALGSGTCAEYAWGVDDCDEAVTPLRPDTVYGRCKLALGLAFEAAAALYGGSAVWGRLFFPYGAGEAEGRLIPSVIAGLLRGEIVECTHGRQIRDFIHVDDVAEALAMLLDGDMQGAVNIGTGTGTSLRDVVAVVTARLGGADLVRFGARQPPPGDPDRVVASARRLWQTGWRPVYGIDTGIETTISAWRERLAS